MVVACMPYYVYVAGLVCNYVIFQVAFEHYDHLQFFYGSNS
jgi:hypothetical protein